MVLTIIQLSLKLLPKAPKVQFSVNGFIKTIKKQCDDANCNISSILSNVIYEHRRKLGNDYALYLCKEYKIKKLSFGDVVYILDDDSSGEDGVIEICYGCEFAKKYKKLGIK